MPNPVDRRSVLALFAAGLTLPLASACGGGAATARTAGRTDPPRGAGPDVLMLVRHAEKPDGSGVHGVTADGQHDSESLTVRGWTRAGALVELFAARDAHGTGRTASRDGLVTPVNVYASNPGRGGSRRPEQTVSPLAAALGTTVRTPVEKGQEGELVALLRSSTGPTLVAWQHEAIPAIVAHLGPVTPAPPSSWPSDRYDVVWVFRRATAAQPWSFTQVPQLLLAGDAASTIGQ